MKTSHIFCYCFFRFRLNDDIAEYISGIIVIVIFIKKKIIFMVYHSQQFFTLDPAITEVVRNNFHNQASITFCQHIYEWKHSGWTRKWFRRGSNDMVFEKLIEHWKLEKAFATSSTNSKNRKRK